MASAVDAECRNPGHISRERAYTSLRLRNASRSNKCTSCSFFRSAPCSGGISLRGSRSLQHFRRHVLVEQQLQPVQQLRRRRLLLQARHFAHLEEDPQRFFHQPLLDAGEMHVDDLVHRVDVGKLDVVEEAAAQEGVRQFLLVVRGDHHDRAQPGLDVLAGLVDEELHAIEFEQQIVGKFDVGLVDFVDQQHRALVVGEGLPQFAALDVVPDVVNPGIAELAVAQPRHRVVFVKALLRLGGGLDVPGQKRRAERLGDFLGQHGLAGAGLALDQQRTFEHDRGVDGDLEVIGGDVVFGAGKFHREFALLLILVRRDAPRPEVETTAGSAVVAGMKRLVRRV